MDIASCVEDCVDKNSCLVLTGHSQGGSIAQVAGIVHRDKNPWVITSGHGRSLNPECSQIDATRWIRFVNTQHNPAVGLMYDLWPFFSQIDHLMWNHGTTYVFSDDETAVADIQVNGYEPFWQLDAAGAHFISNQTVGGQPGYLERIKTFVANDAYPIRTNGYSKGYHCTRDVECLSGSCEAINFFQQWIKKCQ